MYGYIKFVLSAACLTCALPASVQAADHKATSMAAFANEEPAVDDLERRGIFPSLDKSDLLLGLDADANGVRDDIERYIAKRLYPAAQTAAAVQLAKAFQSTLSVDVTDPIAMARAGTALARGIDCIFERFPEGGEASKLGARLEALTFNTELRTRRYIGFNVGMDGSVIKSVRQGACTD